MRNLTFFLIRFNHLAATATDPKFHTLYLFSMAATGSCKYPLIFSSVRPIPRADGHLIRRSLCDLRGLRSAHRNHAQNRQSAEETPPGMTRGPRSRHQPRTPYKNNINSHTNKDIEVTVP